MYGDTSRLSLSSSLSLFLSILLVDSRAIIHLQIILCVRVLRACVFLVVDSQNEHRFSRLNLNVMQTFSARISLEGRFTKLLHVKSNKFMFHSLSYVYY